MLRPVWLVLPVLVAAGCDRGPTVTVDTTPPNAVVWRGDEIIGPAPVTVALPRHEVVRLRIARPGYEDSWIDVDAGRLPEGNAISVSLERRGSLALRCESTPEGADVYVDGEYRGRTPLELGGLEPRPLELAFRMKNRQQVTQTVDPTAIQDEPVVHVELESLTESYYLQQIEADPQNLAYYVDLAHHYVLEHRFEEAAGIFGKGIDVTQRSPDSDEANRLWSEISRVIEKQYDYGGTDEVKTARAFLLAMLERAVANHGGQTSPQLYAAYITVLDTLNRRQLAQEMFEEAWKRHRGNRWLEHLRKQRRFALP